MTKKASDRGYGFTPGGWKFVAVAFAFLVVHNNLADAGKLWTDESAATSQQEGEGG